MKLSVRIIVLALAVLLVLPFIASCQNNDTPTPGDTTAGENNDSTPSGEVTDDPEIDKDGYQKDHLDQYNLNYKDDKINILHWKAEHDEFEAEANTGDTVGDQIANRNEVVMSRLGVELVFTQKDGNNNYITQFIQDVEADYGSKTWDIIASYSRTGASLSTRGFYMDLNIIEDNYMEYSMPWWPDNLIDTVTIGDSLYFVSGDMSTNMYYMMYTIFFSKTYKDSLTAVKDENFYKLVSDGDWTIDKLIEICDQVGSGKGNKFNSPMDAEYAFAGIYYGLDAFYIGSNLSTVVATDDDDYLVLSDDYTSDKARTLFDKVKKIAQSTNNCIYEKTQSDPNLYWTPFTQGNCLFLQDRARFPIKYLTDVDESFSFGVLPTPAYDKAQATSVGYLTAMANPFTLYGISADCDSAAEMTAVLECWASEAYRKTSPAIFEAVLKGRYADLPDDANMWNVIRGGVNFDLGRLYHSSVLGAYLTEKFSVAAVNDKNWASEGSTVAKFTKTKLTALVDTYKSIQAKQEK